MPLALSPLRCLARGRDLFGRHEAIVEGEHQFVYSEFAERAQRLAGALTHAGLNPGEPVAFLCRNSHALLEAYFGVPLAGGLVLPLNVRLVEPELAYILRDSGARFLFYSEEFARLAELLNVPHAVALGQAYERLLETATALPIDCNSLDENRAASLFYTSGTTGFPKGVAHSHRSLYLHALSVALTFHIDETTVELHTIPLFHANGWGRPHAATLMGARQVVLPRFSPAEVFRLVETERVTSMGLVPTMAEQLLAFASERDISSLREIHLGGSAVSAELIGGLEQRFQCLCTAGYGMTETGPVATTGRSKRGVNFGHHNAGWPVVGASIRVDAPEDGKTPGEVSIGGDHLMLGYWGDASKETQWIETGDIATWDRESYLSVVDRKKDLVISGGENISSAEIERVLSGHPSVAECAIVALPDPTWGEVPLAYVVCRSPVTDEELTLWLKPLLARFKIPKQWRFVPGPLPRTATGKLVKTGLRLPLPL